MNISAKEVVISFAVTEKGRNDIRYIDADALYEKLYPLDLVDKRLYSINAKAVADAIDNIPTADVVPKSEVEKIFADIEKIRSKEIHRCEVMRDKEIVPAQRNYWEGGYNSLRQLSYWIAELKKKYTEGDAERICANCKFYDEDRHDQPCCSCVEHINFEAEGEGNV